MNHTFLCLTGSFFHLTFLFSFFFVTFLHFTLPFLFLVSILLYSALFLFFLLFFNSLLGQQWFRMFFFGCFFYGKTFHVILDVNLHLVLELEGNTNGSILHTCLERVLHMHACLQQSQS